MAIANEKESVAIRIPGYVIEREIGRGGVATVFLAIQQSLDRKVALKVMSPALAAEPDFSVRFEREGRIVAGFSHPNIVTIYDVGVSNFQHYIAMEYLGSGSLKRQLVAPLDPHRALKIVKELSAALGYAHSHGYVHRDVKPENVLFKSDGVAVLTDFGIAKSSNSHTQLTRTGTIVGTPRYMSPEQAHGNAATPQSDIYALGVILFEMLTGKPPFDTAESVAVLYSHINDPIPALPEQSRVLQPLVDAMMAKETDNRVPDCDTLGDLVTMLERELDSPTGSHRRVWRPVVSIEQQRRDAAAGTEGPRTESTFVGNPVTTGELQNAILDTSRNTALHIDAAPPPARRKRGRLYAGMGAVAMAFVAAVLIRTGTLRDWLNPPPDLPNAVVLTDEEPLPQESDVVSSTVVSDSGSESVEPVDTAEPIVNSDGEQSVSISTGEADDSVELNDSSPATIDEPVTDSDSASTFTDNTDSQPLPDSQQLALSEPEDAADIDTNVPVATGTAVDPSTVSGTMLAPPAPGTNETPNTAADVAVIAQPDETTPVEEVNAPAVSDSTNSEADADAVTPSSVNEDAVPVADSNENDPSEQASADSTDTESTPADSPLPTEIADAKSDSDTVSNTTEVAADESTDPEPDQADSEVTVTDQVDSGETVVDQRENEGAATEAVAQTSTGEAAPVDETEAEILAQETQVAVSESEPILAPVEASDTSENPPANLDSSDVSGLISVANILVAEDKLAHPPEDNAVDVYQTVLAIEPDNIEAKAGLENIAGIYLDAAMEKVQQPDLALAALEIERGLKARPEHAPLIELQGEVRNMIEANAAYEEAENYFFGLDGPIDLVRSCDRYLEAAEKGHSLAALGLGICFANGFGFEQDEQQAVRWMNFAAEAEEPEAMYNLGLGLLFGDSPDPERAADYIRKAAEFGYERAYRVLGWMHQTGTGVEQSTRDAIKWGFRGAINERSETDSSTRKVVERWESVFQDAYNEAVSPQDEQQDDSSS